MRVQRFGWLALIAVCSCGGGAASGEGAETGGVTDDAPVASSDTAPEAPKAEAAEAKAPEAPAPETSEATTLDAEALGTVLQAVLRDPELVDHLHLEKPGRAPLLISGPNLPDKLDVVVGSYDVEVIADPKSTKKPVLVFTLIERSGEQTRVHYRYDAEGIKGSATLFLQKGHWGLSANRVIEK